jgi:hypothetical protein
MGIDSLSTTAGYPNSRVLLHYHTLQMLKGTHDLATKSKLQVAHAPLHY